MILPFAKFRVIFTEKPVIKVKNDKGEEEIKDWGKFKADKKHLVLSIYDDGNNPTAFLVTDQNREFRWISATICRKA